MTAPNLFLTYVTDAAAAAAWYADLFDLRPSFESPRYVAFEIAPGVLFAVWSGARRAARPGGEVALMLSGGPEAIDATYAAWRDRGVDVVEAPHDDVFGRTFVVADPDGNLLRVCPVD